MTIEERMDKIEAAFGKQDALVIELRNAVTVSAALEARHEQVMKDHTEWLRGHDQAMLEFREQNKAFREQTVRLREDNAALDAKLREESAALDAKRREDNEALDAKRRQDNKELDERIAKLVIAIGAFISERKKSAS
jgi:hypothetical protein